ncbi:MAG: hypothetical protein JO349_06165, partial [Candidatus Eremiobacteraeota bacterium]|nr:hypothetical protein [Candidatus Eremiobacteraeota bacterium]
MAAFAALWLFWGGAFAGNVPTSYVVIAAVVEGVLVGCAIMLIRKGRALQREYPLAEDISKRTGRAFGIVFAVEFLAIAAGNTIASMLKHLELAPAWTAFVV